MAKKKSSKKAKDEMELDPNFSKLPKEAQAKLKGIKKKLDKFKDQLMGKFDKYIMGISLLPPQKEEEKVDKDKIHALVLIDDSDSQKMSKMELKTKLTAIIESIAKDIDKNLIPQTIIMSELWQSCYDAKYDLLGTIAMSAPVFDKGMLAAIKICEIHKTMVLKKFEKYIVSYVLSGSLMRGQATETSDIDVFVVIDDTDVKKMTRAELKDKLRAIIIGMGIEAGEITGIKNKLNIQAWILTDFWDGIKEANPVFFTLLRDGVPLYDRGMFMPWKQLLQMGKIKPSSEAIDMFMGSGEQMLKRVGFKMREIGMEDIYYAILTPSQAALMLYGIAPPDPRETAKLMKDIFVKKEKLLEEKYVKILEHNIDIRKKLEHGTLKELSGAEIDKLLKNGKEYLERIKNLFGEIDKVREKESVVHVYDTCIAVIRDILRLEGVDKADDKQVVSLFRTELVNFGKIPNKFLRSLNAIVKAKKDYDSGKLTKSEVEKVKRDSGSFIKFLVEYIQRKRGRELERTKIRVKHGKKYGEVLLLDTTAFIIHDIDNKDAQVSKAKIKPNGSLGPVQKSTIIELEKALTKIEIPPKVFIKQPIFDDMKNIFGKDVEVLINY